MSKLRNFDKEIARFLELKERLHDWDAPKFLREEAKRDSDCMKVCVELFELARTLRESELSAKGGIIFPTSGNFRSAWNDYRKRWEKDVRAVWTFAIAPDIAELLGDVEFESLFAAGTKEQISKHENTQFAERIRHLKEISNLLEGEYEDEADALNDFTNSAIQLWKSTGFSADSAFERLDLAPVALAPHSVSHKAALNTSLSLFGFWNEARKAYILGLPLASIALSRATLETLLRDVHGAGREGANKLEDYIQFIKRQKKFDAATMHKIQKAANEILHGSTDGFFGKQVTQKPDATACKILFDLKDLIEAS